MSTKHTPSFTPGPWMLATSNSWRRIVTQFDTREVCVPTKQSDGHPDLHFPNPADAPLIVAAPDMLEALKEFDEEFAALDPLSRVSRRRMRRAVIKARAAIEKATGGAQ